MGNKRKKETAAVEAVPATGKGARDATTGDVTHPRKRMFRARAHSNPLNETVFDVPICPEDVDWSQYYPAFFGGSVGRQGQAAEGQAASVSESASSIAAETPKVRFADIGCGFGGLLVRLSPLYPDTLMVGMELRNKVADYVKERIIALRREREGGFTNLACVRTNAMKCLPNYFQKGQLTKMFFLFPDPHFKAANHRRRIINDLLLTEYAYLLSPGGWLYTITDVEALGTWMHDKLEAHPMFERVSEAELDADPAANLLTGASEEGQKVARNKGSTYRNVYRRLSAPRQIVQ